jgi:hypothetical protein
MYTQQCEYSSIHYVSPRRFGAILTTETQEHRKQKKALQHDVSQNNNFAE